MVPIQTVYWKTVRNRVAEINPAFAAAVDAVAPGQQFPIYSVTYPFGQMIFDEGILNIPHSNGRWLPLNHADVPVPMKEQLSYRAIPIGLMLKHSAEVHVDTQDRIIPLTILSQGTPFGLWEALDPLHSYFTRLAWCVSSGARSLYLLCKISEATGHRRLKQAFGVRSPMPKRLRDQWAIFREITQHEDFPSPWASQVLFFSKPWFEQLTTDSAWIMLKNYCYETVWQQSMFWRAEATLDLVWQSFAAKLNEANVKCGAYHLETLKHLVRMGVGALPLFVAADAKESLGPVQGLQQVLVDCYGLKDYIPTFIQPARFAMERPGSIGYYSINEPTLIESVQRNREILNIKQVIRDVKQLYERLQVAILEDGLKIENTPIFSLMQSVAMDFFHTDPDPSGQLEVSALLPKEDRLLTEMSPKEEGRRFCESSTFLRGCVRMRVKA